MNISMSDHESIRNAINLFKTEYANLKWGKDWKSELTCASVSKLESLNYRGIIEKIVCAPPSESQFNLAFMLAETLTETIFDVETNAFKLVNGSLGEWCPNAARYIWEMFRDIYISYNKLIDIKEFVKKLENIRVNLDYYGITYDWVFEVP